MKPLQEVEIDVSVNNEARQNADTLIRFLQYNQLYRNRMTEIYGNVDDNLKAQFKLMGEFATKYGENK